MSQHACPRPMLVLILLVGIWGCTDEPDRAGGPGALSELHLDTTAVIGSLEGEEWEVFGAIQTVAPGPDGVVAILDGQSATVTLVDADGRHVDGIRARGEGPGELNRPQWMAWEGRDLHVLDPSNGRISVFHLEGDALEFTSSVSTNLWGPTNFCHLDGDRWISSWRDGAPIHRLDSEGASAATLSDPPEVPELAGVEGAPRDVALFDLAASWLVCLPAENALVEVGVAYPRIRLHALSGPDGEARAEWTTRPEEIHPLTVEIVNGGGVGIRPHPETGSHLARSAFLWDTDHLLVQYEPMHPPGTDLEESYLESRLFELATGAEVDRSRALPLLMAADDSHLFAVQNEPWPRVLVLERP